MACLHGKSGTVTYGGAQATVTNWTIDINAEAVEDTSMTDTLRGRILGLKDWTATVTCYMVANTGPTLGAAAAIGVVEAYDDTPTAQVDLALSDGTNTITGKAYARDWTLANPVDGMAQVTINYDGAGALA